MIDDCPGDSELWPLATGEPVDDSLNSHVALCNRCSQRVQALRAELHSLRAAGSFCAAIPTSANNLPDRIGEYEVLSFVGHGGQADVYRAWHPRLKIDVVVKWYRACISHTQQGDWEAAATALCAINHPHLGRLYDIGVEQGRPFQVIEFVRGQMLLDWIRTYRPSLLRMMTVLAQVARAVETVHQHGALHLDLKPENILIDDLGNPCVIDFGMARVANGRSESVMMSPGTPEYMSPEQCAGDGERIGIASDVYGLGAVLFSLLTGQPPRTEKRMTLEPNWKLLRGSPGRLIKICRKAMATDIAKRHPSAVSLAKELDDYVQHHHWTGRSVSTIVSVVGCLGLLIGLASSVPSDSQARFAVNNWRIVNRSGALNRHTRAEVTTAYAPQWFMTTCRSGPTRITENVTIQAPESTYEPQWGSTIELDLTAAVGPCLLACGQNRALVDCSNELRSLHLTLKDWQIVYITPAGIQWNRLLEQLSIAEQQQVVRTGEEIRRQFAVYRAEFFAMLVIPPTLSEPNNAQ